MKTLKPIFFAALLAMPFVSVAQEPDSTGMPGDHFDLRGALELFKNAETPEAFEKALNTESSKINNLDLNGDNQIDYIRVIDRADGKNHAIVMQAAVSETETQDVAVIVLEQTGENEAHLQIVGDETVYGEEKVVEPYEEVGEKKVGPSAFWAPADMVIVNVWTWPCVHYIFMMDYVPYISPWYWGFYPIWFHPWPPVFLSVYWVNVYHYHHYYYRYVPDCTMHNAHAIYRTHRTTSGSVETRYAAHRASYQARRQAEMNKAKQPNAQPDKQPQPIGAEKKQRAGDQPEKGRTAKPEQPPKAPQKATKTPNPPRKTSPRPQRQTNPAPQPVNKGARTSRPGRR